MGGFTQIKLIDCSPDNVERQNAKLAAYRVPKQYRFQDLEKNQAEEYKWFVKGKGAFPESQFPKDQIHSLEDFKKFWNPSALGEVFAPPTGTLQFDCYFGRTSKNAMRAIGKYLAANLDQIKKFEGSFFTFMERGMTKEERALVDASGIKY
jgi:hypothetical protein